MLTGIMAAISGNAIIGWLMRRIPDWGGWVMGWLGMLLTLFSQLDPATQAIILTVLRGNWQEITLGGAVGFLVMIFGQWRSWRATVKPHVVLPDRKIRELSEAEARAIVGYDGPIEDRTR